MTNPKPCLFAVDDEPHNLDYIERCLRDWDVRSFTDPRVALDEAVRENPAVIILDFRMPELNGVELVKELRARGIDCPVLMLTAFPEIDEAVFAQQSKLLFQILAKPATPAFLRQQVELCVGG